MSCFLCSGQLLETHGAPYLWAPAHTETQHVVYAFLLEAFFSYCNSDGPRWLIDCFGQPFGMALLCRHKDNFASVNEEHILRTAACAATRDAVFAGSGAA